MRLIDADMMNEDLFYEQVGGKDSLITAECAFNMIMAQPTAYDIYNVVEQIKSAKDEDHMVCYINDKPVIEKQKAIEIVKHGGVSDDVCEWRLCDEEANVYDTSCRNPHILIEGTPKENNYEFCPYCGRKIKEMK